MKVDRRALYSALTELVRVTDPKASLPILSHVLLQAVAGVLTLRATDLKRNLCCQLPAEGDFETCLPAKLLANLIKPKGRGDAGDVVIEGSEGTSCSVTFEGLSSRLVPIAPEQFPTGPKSDDQWSLLALWPSNALREVLRYVLPAASPDDDRPHLNAVCLDAGRIITTDGHRLHLAELPSELPAPLLVPLESAKTMDRILKLGEQVILARSGDILRVRAGAWQLDTRLADARFPPYQKVIPVEWPTMVTVDHSLFSKALARVSRLTRNPTMRLTINGQMTIATSDPDLGEAEVVVPLLESNHEGGDIVMGVNAAYLKDAVGPKQKSFRIGLGQAGDAMRLDLEKDKLAVVMPVRL